MNIMNGLDFLRSIFYVLLWIIVFLLDLVLMTFDTGLCV